MSSCVKLLMGCLSLRLVTLTAEPLGSHALWTQGWLTLQEPVSVHRSHKQLLSAPVLSWLLRVQTSALCLLPLLLGWLLLGLLYSADRLFNSGFLFMCRWIHGLASVDFLVSTNLDGTEDGWSLGLESEPTTALSSSWPSSHPSQQASWGPRGWSVHGRSRSPWLDGGANTRTGGSVGSWRPWGRQEGSHRSCGSTRQSCRPTHGAPGCRWDQSSLRRCLTTKWSVQNMHREPWQSSHTPGRTLSMVPGVTGRSAYRVPHPTPLSYSKETKDTSVQEDRMTTDWALSWGRQAGVWELGAIVGWMGALKRYVRDMTPESVNVTLFGSRSLQVWLVTDLEMRSSWIGVALNQRGHPSNRCRYRGDTRWRWSQRWEGGGHKLRDAWSTQNWKRQEEPFSGASGGSAVLGHPDLSRLVSRTERGQASFVPSLCVCSSVTAAPGNSCSWWEVCCPDLKPASH